MDSDPSSGLPTHRVTDDEVPQFFGTALLEYSFLKIDVYQITYSKSKNSQEQLELDYKISVKKEYGEKGWQVGCFSLSFGSWRRTT